MKVAVVKYNAGNICSVMNALGRLGVEARLTDVPEELMQADKVIFPGQGEAASAMAYLRSHSLDEVILRLTRPVLGICIGQQLLCQHSEEGDVDCLGIFPIDVRRFRPTDVDDKVPAMGWNQLSDLRSPLFQGLSNPYVYFVHSFYVPVCAETIATTDYILPYSASMHKDNFYTCQFHPEKSGKVGEQILKNFLEL